MQKNGMEHSKADPSVFHTIVGGVSFVVCVHVNHVVVVAKNK